MTATQIPSESEQAEFQPSMNFPNREREAELEARFEPTRIGQLASEFLEVGVPGVNLREMAGDRQFVLAYIPATSPYSDIGRSVETQVFSKYFKQSLSEVEADYGGKYDRLSTLATVIDVSKPLPVAAGVLRIVDYDPTVGFKDVDDLVKDTPDNPWAAEIKREYFAPGEQYDPVIAWQRMTTRVFGSALDLSRTQDISTHASADGYRNKHGGIDGPSMLFFHACLRRALADKIGNLVAIFDLKPFENVQGFGEPFDVYPGLGQYPYGGPGDTVPAACTISNALERIGAFDEVIGKGAFINGELLDQTGLLPNEYDPEHYSNEAVADQIAKLTAK